MATLAAVRDALKVRLDTIADPFDAYNLWPDTVNPPCALVSPVSASPHTTFSARGSFFFDVLVLAAALEQGGAKAQDKLDGYLDLSGADSLVGAIEGDLTLGGSAETVLTGEWSDYGEIEVNDIKYLGARLAIEVCVTT